MLAGLAVMRAWLYGFGVLWKDVIYFNLRRSLSCTLKYYAAVGGECDGQGNVVFEGGLKLLAAQDVCQFRPCLFLDSRVLEEMPGQVQRNGFLGAGEIGDDDGNGPPSRPL